MRSPLQRELLVVTGKGGVGKTTVASAIGLLASDRGLRTIVVEVGEQARLPALFDTPMPAAGVEIELQPGLWSLTIDPDRALLEWLQALGGRVSGRVLASSNTFQYFAAAAPGAKELISMVKIWELTRGNRWRGRERGRRRGYDLVVLDAPATGHALGMLGSPSTFGRIARVGPIASQAERLRALLEDPARSSYFAVAQATEMAISETLELQERLRERLGRELDAVVVNGVLPQRFSNGELRALAPLRDNSGGPVTTASTVRRSALLAARTVSERARFQRNQLARLRRRSFAVIAVPFQFTAELDLASVQRIAAHLGRTI
ncbi:MAG TPA: ArsA family ATPase [Solirubrobacteraceae bacterium]|nr:ArsA family ATPase [Solirubrobacteraceae bacterium]